MDEFEEVTDAECDGAHNCDLCSLYGPCRDRRPIEKCAICGRSFTDEELFNGVCKECLEEAVDPYTVRKYVADRSTADNILWESLFESYFSESDDKCQIGRVSEPLKDRLMRQIILEFDHDRMFAKNGMCVYHAKDRLVAWVGEDEVAWGDFADWLVEKKGVLKK